MGESSTYSNPLRRRREGKMDRTRLLEVGGKKDP
jgi:hypothetical protein